MAFSRCRYLSGLLTCSVGPLKLSLRISSFGYHLVSWRAITGPNFKPGGQTNPEISRGGHMPPIPTVEVSEVALRRVKLKIGWSLLWSSTVASTKFWIFLVIRFLWAIYGPKSHFLTLFALRKVHKNPITEKIENLVDAIVEDPDMKISANF